MGDVERIDPSRITIARRWSKLEWEMHQKGLSQEELLAHYERMGLKERKWSSHLEQMRSFEQIKNALPNARITVGEDIKKEDFIDSELVVALGGDGHFSFVSHFIKDQYVVGVNADPQKSTGALLQFAPDQFMVFLPKIEAGSFGTEYWTRLQAAVNGEVLPELALSDLFIGSRLSVDMSRYVLKFYHHGEEEKTSGILVSTGTGSTGWHRKIHLSQQRESGRFLRNERRAKFIVREEPAEEWSDYYLVKGDLYPGEELVVQSYTDDAVVSPDSYRGLMYEFNSGSTAVVKIDENPLRVITPHMRADRYVYQLPMSLGENSRGKVMR